MAGYCTLVLCFHSPVACENTAIRSCNIQPYCLLTYQIYNVTYLMHHPLQPFSRRVRIPFLVPPSLSAHCFNIKYHFEGHSCYLNVLFPFKTGSLTMYTL